MALEKTNNINALVVENLTFSYVKEDVLKDVSFSVKKGEWVSVIGHNGSGKSTLAKLIVGLLEAKKGKIVIDGIDLTIDNLNDIRTKLGIVFQNPDNQFVGVTVKHDVAFGLENRQIPRKEMLETIKKVLEEVHMEKYLDSEPQNLSGGEKQRVAIAGALAMDQDIIIFDEATSMLDPEGTNDIVNIIKRLNKELNKTIITITHDLEFAALSDRIIVLSNGIKIYDDTVSEVFKHEKELKETGLEIPMSLSLYNRVTGDDILGKNKNLQEALWKLNLKK